MGLSIHFSGRLKSQGSLPELIEEVKDIAEIYKWHYSSFVEEFPAGSFKKSFNHRLYGICFTPPDCETVNLTFLSDGRLTSPWHGNIILQKKKMRKF